ncbi:MAG: PD-(D/E)XK nuclease domain-containing protein [Lachnospiraceae bacterium]|nr:PD-(D/E)XK nuclease domain-containing protein [Lachnospiraceae bacterium]
MIFCGSLIAGLSGLHFYHGILLGILSCYNTWIVSSNKEAGDGYSDILLMMDDGATGVVIEVKYAENGNMEKCCRETLEQIESNRYEEALRDEGSERILSMELPVIRSAAWLCL